MFLERALRAAIEMILGEGVYLPLPLVAASVKMDNSTGNSTGARVFNSSIIISHFVFFNSVTDDERKTDFDGTVTRIALLCSALHTVLQKVET